MKDYKQKLYDFTPDYIFGRILLAVVLGVTIATTVVFVKTAHAINTYPYEDFMVSDDMADYIVKYGKGQDFSEEDMH
jgi:hypothetical protein